MKLKKGGRNAPPTATPGHRLSPVPELEVRNLSKRYGKTVAVDDLSFAVEAGRVTGFLGPNGAGKTTTMRALLGLLRPSRGEALVEGAAAGRDGATRCARSAPRSRRPPSTPAAAAATTCAPSPPRPASPARGSTRCWRWSS